MIPLLTNRDVLLAYARRAQRPTGKLYRLLIQDDGGVDWLMLHKTIADAMVALKEFSDLVDQVMKEVVD